MANKSLSRRMGEASTQLSPNNFAIPSPQPIEAQADQPEPEWVRGTCPECGASLVSNMYYVGGRGYLIVWECWRSLSESPKCSYRRVL